MTTAYERLGVGYAAGRRADPRWQAAIDEALGDARTVVNVGAGTGSYEPADRLVIGVEPSPTMIAQRSARSAPVVRATAERLPFEDGCFEAALGVLTLHHWTDWAAGVREARRVAARIVLVHFDPVPHTQFWLARDYLPELADVWRRVPSAVDVAGALGGAVVSALPVPADCLDGFLPAYWQRPQAYLRPEIRSTMSGLQLLDDEVLAKAVARLAVDLEDGTWHRKNSDVEGLVELDVGFRLITAQRDG